MNGYQENRQAWVLGNVSLPIWLLLLICLAPIARGQELVSIQVIVNSVVQSSTTNENPQTDAALDLAISDSNSSTSTSSVPSSPAPATSDPATSDAAAEKRAVGRSIEVDTDSSNADVDEGLNQKPDTEKQLSVAPQFSIWPEGHPTWIKAQPDYKSTKHSFVVASIPMAHESDVDTSLDVALQESLKGYVEELFQDHRAGDLLDGRLSADRIRNYFLSDKASYVGQLNTTHGPMFQKWVCVEVTPQQQAQLQKWYREQIQQERLATLGIVMGSLGGCVFLSHLLLRRAASKSR